jgi:cytochrome c peroxidase
MASSSSAQQAPGSPKLHSLPDNTLNPLGLLAEASLANRRAQAASRAESRTSATSDNQPKLGVASDVYFKPGMSQHDVVSGSIAHRPQVR